MPDSNPHRLMKPAKKKQTPAAAAKPTPKPTKAAIKKNAKTAGAKPVETKAAAKPVAQPGGAKKKKSPVVPIVVGVLVAGAAGTGGYFGYTALSSDEPRYGGSVVIGPF